MTLETPETLETLETLETSETLETLQTFKLLKPETRNPEPEIIVLPYENQLYRRQLCRTCA